MSGHPDALDVLRRANPVTAEEARSLPLEPLVAPTREPFEREGRRKRRNRLALAIGMPVVLALVVAPAFGLGRDFLPFFSAEKAPPRVVVDFHSMSTGAPPGMDPGVIADETRKIGVWRYGGKEHTLWVAPTHAGGVCFEWAGDWGGCDREGSAPLDVGTSPVVVPGQGGKPADAAAQYRATENAIATWVTGRVSATYAASVEIRFADGTVARPQITWVSAPIDEGFFAYEVPADHRSLGHRAISVVALDSDGNRVTEQPLVGSRRDPLADAVISKRRPVLELQTSEGPATLFTAPTRYDGQCVFLELGKTRVPVYPCIPHGYRAENLAIPIIPLPTTVLLSGAVPSRVTEVELRFADGDMAVLHPRGFLLYEIPMRHRARSSELTQIIDRDSQGQELLRLPLAPLDKTPCHRPLPLSAGVHCRNGF